MYLYMSLIFNFLLSGISFVHSEVCNPIECFALLSKIFQFDLNTDSCAKITKIENCFRLCHSSSNYVDNNVFQGLQVVKQEICENDQDNRLSNKCVDKHKYLLLSCLYESFNLNAVSADADSRLLMCRKISEAQHCDQSTLVVCSLHAGYITEVLLEKLFRPLHSEFCTYETKDIYDLNVTYPVLSNDYKNLALCFDANSHLVDQCVPNKSSNSVINSFFSYKLCKAIESFVDCLHGIVREKCHNERIIFKSISQSLYQYVLPKCFPYSKSNKADKGSFENYQDGASKNSSDMVVVHQHIVVNVIGHRHSGGSLLFNFFKIMWIVCALSEFLFYKYLLYF